MHMYRIYSNKCPYFNKCSLPALMIKATIIKASNYHCPPPLSKSMITVSVLFNNVVVHVVAYTSPHCHCDWVEHVPNPCCSYWMALSNFPGNIPWNFLRNFPNVVFWIKFLPLFVYQSGCHRDYYLGPVEFSQGHSIYIIYEQYCRW